MNLDPIYKEAGQITLEAIRKLFNDLKALERKVGIVVPGGQIDASAISFSLGGAVFYQQPTEPAVPAGLGFWEDTSPVPPNPHKHYRAHTNSTGVRVWKLDN